jgi:hypothetical protein
MNCRKASRLLPLLVGRDLDERTFGAVASHCSVCAACRRLEEELRASWIWLRGIPPPAVGETDYSSLRRAVWRRIETSETAAPGRVGLRPSVLAAAAALVLLLFIVPILRNLRTEVGVAAPVVATAPVKTPVRTAFEVVATPANEGVEPAAPEPKSVPPRRLAARAPKKPAAGPEELVRIEFQTDHPDVRIIWLVQKQEAS